jgi:hypothetical protein
MKNFYLFAFISLIIVSCSENEVTPESISSAKKEISIMEFSSEKDMEYKIEEIISLKNQKEKVVLNTFKNMTNSKTRILGQSNVSEQKAIQNNLILEDLKLFHKEKLKSIYELRRELNFTSIQSIADEINSLIIVDPSKAKILSSKFERFLTKNIVEIETIFDDWNANVINDKGEVLVEGKLIDLKKYAPKSSTARYLGDESIRTGIAANSGNYFVYFFAGREVHKNFIGVRYFKYFTQLKSFVSTSNGLVATPSTFTVNSGSIAGFVQTRSQFFSDYSFSYSYPSGNGTSVRFVGGNKNTPYIPAGGKIAGKFSTTIGGVYQEMTCDMSYTAE